jgi:hypothetical protein
VLSEKLEAIKEEKNGILRRTLFWTTRDIELQGESKSAMTEPGEEYSRQREQQKQRLRRREKHGYSRDRSVIGDDCGLGT